MKLQSLSIIFIIIIFPMILVLSYYIGLQIDTITLHNKYNNELIDATNDAMSAFELNTANEQLSNVSDSLRSIVDASTNTFINTLSTSLGLSNVNKNDIEPYIPSILYTMYDGYYIYAPTKTPVILEKKSEVSEDGLIITDGYLTVGEEGVIGNSLGEYTYTEGEAAYVHFSRYNDYGSLLYKVKGEDCYTTEITNDTEFNTDYVLKSYMPYSATYTDGSNTATINYTLDNFMSISAQIGDVYYTKSGYYIDTSLINNCNISDWDEMGQDELKEYCENTDNSIEIIVNESVISTDEGETEEVKESNRKAITYYLTNAAFSKWVNGNLSFVTGENLKTVVDFDNLKDLGYSNENITNENITNIYHNFKNEKQSIFDNAIDPEDEDSDFNNHKYNIIKNSIQYNLNLAISSYSAMFQGLSFEMPQLSDTEWKEITEKISIVSFLQGLDCGLKQFNGYALVSSTNNEMTVIPEEIYYVKAGEFNDENSYYHRIDCENISTYAGDFISFKSKEVKYDAIDVEDTTATIDYPAEYDHKNLACYDCIVQNNYSNYDSNSDGNDDKKIKLRAFLGFEQDSDEDGNYINDVSITSNLQKAYYIAIGKERQNLYKTTAYSKNEGLQTFNSVSSIIISDSNKIDKFEITLEVPTPDYDKIVDNVIINGDHSTKKNISTISSYNQTIEIDNNNYSDISTIVCEYGTEINILSIKVIYK